MSEDKEKEEEELDRLLRQSHDGITSLDIDGKKVPCIMFEEKRYDYILSRVAGKPLAVDTGLNVLQDGLGHVFVEVVLTFSVGRITEKVLVNANRDISFFEHLAETSMLALSSPKSHYGKDNVFVVQLPRPDRAENALGIIRRGLARNSQDGGAVTGI